MKTTTEKSIDKVPSKDTYEGKRYYNWVVRFGKQSKIFYGYRRMPKDVEKEARDFYNYLPATVSVVSKKGVVSELEFPFPSPGFKPGYRQGMKQAIDFDRHHTLAEIKRYGQKSRCDFIRR